MSTTEPPSPPEQPPPPAGSPPPGWTPPPAGYRPPQTDGMAIGALACAIAAFLVCPLVPAIVALFLAHNSQQRINASGGQLTGDGLNTAARIVSWIHIGLCALGIVVFIILVATVDTDNDENDFDSLGVGLQYLAARFGL